MAYQEITDFNTSEGMTSILQYVSAVEPIFFPLMLFVIFIVLSIGSYFAKKEITGRANMIASFAASSFVTTLIAYVLNLMEGVLNNTTVIICLIISILFTLLLFLPKGR